MDWNDKEERFRFIQSMNALQEAVPRKTPLTDAGIKLYAYSLEDVPIDDVVRTCVKASQQCEFFPKPVELRKIALGSTEDIAEVEATKAINAIARVGSYRSVVFDNPVTQAVIERSFGGWPKFCEMLESERKWRHKEFVSAYKAFAAQGVQHFGTLHGIAAISNNAHAPNAPEERPAIVGNPQKAVQVMALESSNPTDILLNGLTEKMAIDCKQKCMNESWNDAQNKVEQLKALEK